MSRQLRALVLDLDPRPDEYLLRTGASDPVMSAEGALRWDLGGSIPTPQGGGWLYLGECWPQRFTLPRDSFDEVVADVDGDGEPDPQYRWVDLPPLTAAGLRLWGGAMVACSTPADTAIRWRLGTDGTDEGLLWWDGAAWSAVADPDGDDWCTTADLEAHLADLDPTVRSITPRALLESTDTGRRARPELYGVRLLGYLRDRGEEDDALIRTLVPALRAAIRTTIEARWDLVEGTVRVSPPAGFPYAVTGAPEVYDLTADPDEETPLPGTWYPDELVWVLETVVPNGHRLLAEWPSLPRIETAVQRDGTAASVPAVFLFPAETSRTRGQGDVLVTAAAAAREDAEVQPDGVSFRAPDSVALRVEVRIVAGYASQVRRLQTELEEWIAHHASLLSPESGREISIRSVEPITLTNGQLSAGVVDARGVWELGYHAAGSADATAVDYVRSSGGLLVAAVLPAG